MKKIYKFLFLLFFFTIISPYFGSIDVIAPQWLYLSLVNFLCLIFLFSRKKITNIRSTTFYVYLFFIIQIIISFSYSRNLNVSIVDASRFCIILFSIYIFYNIIKTEYLTFRFISFVVSIFLCVELFYSLIPFFSFFIINPSEVYNQFSTIYTENLFLGFSGNKNITAASIALKLPFLLYFLYSIKGFYKYLILPVLFFAFLLIYFLRARSVFISTTLVLLIFLFFSTYYKRINFLFVVITAIIVGYFASLLISPDLSTNPILTDISSISLTKESSNDRFFLWDNAISYISNNPIIGCGIGNWKIESLPYWNTHLSNYIVPYHAHNELLEITTELGLIGGATYLLFFFLIFSKLIYHIYLYRRDYNRTLNLTVILSSFSVFFIDLMLNFPHERPRIMLIFALLVSLTLIYTSKQKFRL